MAIEIRELTADDVAWVRDFLRRSFGSTRVVSRGVLHHADELPGFIASFQGIPSALLTYRVVGGHLEVVTLHAQKRGMGLGSRLLAAARVKAMSLRCSRMWLITTNDNEPAIAFYKRWGMKLVAVHRDAIVESRKLKPEIAEIGLSGEPIRDEVEFEYLLSTG